MNFFGLNEQVLFVDHFGKFFSKSFRWKGVIFALNVWAIPTKNTKLRSTWGIEPHPPTLEASVITTTPRMHW